MATSGRPLPYEIRAEVLRLLRLSFSQRSIARECGVSLTTVRKLVKEWRREKENCRDDDQAGPKEIHISTAMNGEKNAV